MEGVLQLATPMAANSTNTSGLHADTVPLVRIAALVALGASPAAYRLSLGVADLEVTKEDVLGTVAAVAPIVGTAQLVAAEEAVGLVLRSLESNQEPRNGGSQHGDRF